MPTLLEESPFAFAISTSKKSQVCHVCCRSASGSLRRCSGCRFAHYCNETCQRSGWKDHAAECASLARVHPKVPTDTARLMARIIFKEKASNDTSRCDDGKRTFQMLMSHTKEIQNDSLRMEHFTYVCAMLKECLGTEMLPTASELLEIFGKICINSFSIVNNDGEAIGVGIYLELSVLDHSCAPDAVVVFDGQKAILNSIGKDNPERGDYKKATISYIELLNPSSERRRQLQEQYYFKCSCSRCSDTSQDQIMEALKCTVDTCDGCVLVSYNGDVGTCEKCGSSIADVDAGTTMMQRIQWQLEKLKSLQKEQDFTSVYDLSADLVKEADAVLHPVNVYLIRLLESAFDAAIQLEKWPQAVEHGKAVLPGYRLHYPKGHPSLAHRSAQVGKILQYLGRLEEAEVFLQQAYDEAKLSHGEKHSFFDTITELLFTCQEERRVQLSKLQLSR